MPPLRTQLGSAACHLIRDDGSHGEGIQTAPSDSPKRTPLDQGAREDAGLIRRTLAGDRNAFEGVVRRHHHDLLRLLRGITRNLEDAEDLTQEAFLRAFRALDRFDQNRPFRPWLWTIGTRLALQRLEKKERRNISLDTAGSTDDGTSHTGGSWTADTRDLERIDALDLHLDFTTALEMLDPDHRAVLVLRVLEDRSYEEIAEILEIPQGTVMSRLNRARRRLRETLRGWTPQGETDGRPA